MRHVPTALVAATLLAGACAPVAPGGDATAAPRELGAAGAPAPDGRAGAGGPDATAPTDGAPTDGAPVALVPPPGPAGPVGPPSPEPVAPPAPQPVTPDEVAVGPDAAPGTATDAAPAAVPDAPDAPAPPPALAPPAPALDGPAADGPAADGPAPDPAPPPAPGAVALDLPDGWAELPLDGTGVTEIIVRSGVEDPDFSAQLEAQLASLQAGGALLFAADLESPTSSERGFLTNASVVRLAVGDVTLDALGAQVAASLERIGGQDVEVTRETLPGGDALRTRYRLLEPAPIDVRQYYLLDGRGDAVGLTLGTDRPDDYAADFDGIAASFAID